MCRRIAGSQFPLLATEPAGALWSGIAPTVLFVLQQRRPRALRSLAGGRGNRGFGAQGTSPALHMEILSPGRRKQNLSSWVIQNRVRLHPSSRKNTLNVFPRALIPRVFNRVVCDRCAPLEK
uniref:Uncharacterized protein n=1 Tax=Molossus molossus TaxID=27622 RepID=A0A7J8I9N4_MOLMO|nr:hypothetical protein HJG59_010669 [Molossus molossus]